MRRAQLVAAGFAAVLVALSAAPALAGYGALAREEATGKFGLTWNKDTQEHADQGAIKDCGGGSCKIVFRIKSHQCGAIATEENGKAWGAAWRPERAAAELAAMNDCQKHTSSQCKVRAAGCNR